MLERPSFILEKHGDHVLESSVNSLGCFFKRFYTLSLKCLWNTRVIFCISQRSLSRPCFAAIKYHQTEWYKGQDRSLVALRLPNTSLK